MYFISPEILVLNKFVQLLNVQICDSECEIKIEEDLFVRFTASKPNHIILFHEQKSPFMVSTKPNSLRSIQSHFSKATYPLTMHRLRKSIFCDLIQVCMYIHVYTYKYASKKKVQKTSHCHSRNGPLRFRLIIFCYLFMIHS